MRVLFLTRYSQTGSTSRVRAYQYFSYLKSEGIHIIQAPLFNDEYIRRRYTYKHVGYGALCVSYARRLAQLLKSFVVDIVWIEKELLPGLPAWSEVLLAGCRTPYVVDYDDATFHWYDMHPNRLVRRLLRRKIDAVMRRAALVIVGNGYLAARARQVGAKRIAYLPSAVDLKRYNVAINARKETQSFTIGWIGSPVTAHYLDLVKSALIAVCQDGGTRVAVVGATEVPLRGIPMEIRAWSEETEVASIQSFDVGIMPLADGPWERGKCGYKLIQYMACGKAAVASPVGENRHIIEDGLNGFLATTTREWISALRALREKCQLRQRMGRRGRTKVELEYSLQVTAPRLVSLLRSVAVDRK
jgi:glycosyltransferase involved in cell wall biosynthesis